MMPTEPKILLDILKRPCNNAYVAGEFQSNLTNVIQEDTKMARAQKAPVEELPVEQAPKPDNTISAKLKDGDRVVTVQYVFGANLQEATELFGQDVVFSSFLASAVINLQSLIRSHMKNRVNKKGEVTATPKSDEEINAIVAAWKPGVKQVVRKSAVDKAKDALSQMSPEQKNEFLAQLKADLEAAAA